MNAPAPTDALPARPLDAIAFDDDFVRTFPADSERSNTPRQVRGITYSFTDPTPVRAPRLLGWSEPLAETLGIARPAASDAAVAILAGNALAPGMRPYSSRYGGHQFGNWAGQLGDGRAISLGEMRDRTGGRQELQLKGAGLTPYSRTADGRAVLRSSLREFLCSEAMHHLGIATTRALSLTGTGESVVRDMFYDGNPAPEPGAIVCRVAPSFLRFGHFEILAAQDEPALAAQLAEYVRSRFYPDCRTTAEWFAQLCERTAILVVEWLRVGFVHGVMNTDNMSLLGLTIDYGPYGWLEGVDPGWTPNTTDASGRRYCYGRQPQIAHWNLSRLGSALATLESDTTALQNALGAFVTTFNSRYSEMIAAKLGVAPHASESGEDSLAAALWPVLQQEECDFSMFFRRLALVDAERAVSGAHASELLEPLHACFYSGQGPNKTTAAALTQWLGDWGRRVLDTGVPNATRIASMNATNPWLVARNWLAQQAIDELDRGESAFLERLLRAIRLPYLEQPEFGDMVGRRPEWARHKAGCSALSCSS